MIIHFLNQEYHHFTSQIKLSNFQLEQLKKKAPRYVNNSAREIKRWLDQVTKKCDELQALGVQIEVVYSTSKTNGIYILDDPRITQVIEKHTDKILLNPDWMDDDRDTSHTIAVMLTPLPSKLSILNGLTIKCLIRGIMKDLNLT